MAGASGAGKSTLIEALAGLRRIERGAVRFVDAGGQPVDARIGFVPQDDLIHRDLSLRTTLRFAAALRLPARARGRIDELVDRTLRSLDLADRADVRVRDLSGGERKRASVACELLGQPDVLFVDEPTCGLDPATAAEVVRTLGRVAASGTTVVVTTHHLPDLDRADRLAFIGPGGRLAFVGTAAEARAVARTDDLTALYATTAVPPRPAPARRAAAATADADEAPATPATPARRAPRADRPGGEGRLRRFAHQWRVLTGRNQALLASNRLTMAITFGAPALVVAMMVVLFPAGAAAEPAANPGTAVQSAFWIAFAAFFFGLTAGLLQIVPEAVTVRHEQRSGVGATAYVAAKVTALLPVVIGIGIGMLVALDATDRLPTTGASSRPATAAVVLLTATSALALGLLASALVRDAAQATLALPMLCFPQVLFAGAVVPVADMAGTGWLLSHGMATRWGFEGIGRGLGLADALPAGTGSIGQALDGTPTTALAVLAAVTAGLLVAVVLAVRAGTRPAGPRRARRTPHHRDDARHGRSR